MLGFVLPPRVKMVVVVVLPRLLGLPFGLLTLNPFSHLSEQPLRRAVDPLRAAVKLMRALWLSVILGCSVLLQLWQGW